MPTRGFVWAVYVADDGVTRYAKQVDADSAADPDRGWNNGSAAGLPLFPQRGRPRVVYGVSAITGKRGLTLVGNTNAPIWSGAATTFTVETTDQGTDVMTITRRRGESFAVPR